MPPRSGLVERVAQAEQHVVVRQDLLHLLAAVHFLPHGLREASSDGGTVVTVGPWRDDGCIGMVQHVPGDLPGLGPGELQRVGTAGELAQEQVVDHLLAHVPHVLDEGDLAVDVARRPEAVQHLETEPVRRLYGRGVEIGDGLAQPVPARLDLGPRGVGEMAHDLVVLVGRPAVEDVDQPVEGGDQAVAHPLSQLARGHAGEGDHEEAVDRHRRLGDVARRESGDGEGLAGAGTRLQQRHAPGQPSGEVERLRSPG